MRLYLDLDIRELSGFTWSDLDFCSLTQNYITFSYLDFRGFTMTRFSWTNLDLHKLSWIYLYFRKSTKICLQIYAALPRFPQTLDLHGFTQIFVDCDFFLDLRGSTQRFVDFLDLHGSTQIFLNFLNLDGFTQIFLNLRRFTIICLQIYVDLPIHFCRLSGFTQIFVD